MKKVLVIIGLVFLLAACSQNFNEELESQAIPWQQLGGVVTKERPTLLQLNGAGNPVVAFCRPVNFTYDLPFKRWNGTGWVNYTQPISPNGNCQGYDFKFDSTGKPVSIYVPDDSQTGIAIKRWSGTSWLNYGTGAGIPSSYSETRLGSLSLDSSNRPYVIYQTHWISMDGLAISRWSGTAWIEEELSPLSLHTFEQSFINFDYQGKPVVAWTESTVPYGNPEYQLKFYVKSKTASGWTNAVTPFTLTNTVVQHFALDNQGKPIIVLSNIDGSNVYVKRWNGTAWVNYGTKARIDRGTGRDFSSSLDVDANGYPIVAWHEEVSGVHNIYVKRWNGTQWVYVGQQPVGSVSTFEAYPPQLFPSLDYRNGKVALSFYDEDGQGSFVKQFVF